MKFRLAALVGVAAALLFAAPAHATDTIPVESDCNTGWYVNSDEGDLLPEQVEAGIVFDGPSLMHRAIEPVKLANAPAGSINAVDVTGVSPLFKAETGSPYSTINVRADGKVWSSKIPTGPGSQDSPVDSIAALAPLAPYTADTVINTVGAGYASDAGNKATVTSLTFGETTFELTCKPQATPSTTPTAAPTDPATGEPSSTPAAPVDEKTLPVTGAGVATLAFFGAALVAGGVVAIGYVVARRRALRRRFEA